MAHIIGAARALNNLAVWCLTRWDDPGASEAAFNALKEAERLMSDEPAGGELRAGIFFNLSQLAAASEMSRESNHYLGLARSYGLNVDELLGGQSDTAKVTSPRDSVASHGVALDEEPADVMSNGKTQLMFWAAIGHEDNVRSLIKRGVNLDAVDHDGDTALLYAVSKGNDSLTKLLLRHGADPNIFGESGPPIRLAASRGWTDMVRTLAACGADVDTPSHLAGTEGVTPVMLAAGGGSVECLRILLELGADPSRVDSDGDNALFYAQSNGQSATADVILHWTTTP
jgi:ankyrin repeat protein